MRCRASSSSRAGRGAAAAEDVAGDADAHGTQGAGPAVCAGEAQAQAVKSVTSSRSRGLDTGGLSSRDASVWEESHGTERLCDERPVWHLPGQKAPVAQLDRASLS